MNTQYLNDQIFLNLLDRLKIRVSYLQLTLLDFQERPIREIAGSASGNGTLNINGSSTTRRTISFNMLATDENNDLTNLNNIISLNKKFKVSVGIENPMPEYQKKYGDIIWFKLGTYVINKASLSWSTSACNISISARDKSCMIDGSVSGTLPTTVVFNEIYTEDEQGNVYIEYPTIRQIIQEAVQHYGGEKPHNIIINDLDDKIKKLVKYGGDEPMWIEVSETDLGKNICFTNNNLNESMTTETQYQKFIYGEDVGYTLTDFTYPGELVLSAGETVAALLNKIISVLGNYEWFYDLEGRFIFQEIPNYLNKADSAIYEINEQQYIRTFNNSKHSYSFVDTETIISINNNPNYDNIKNDFIVWGQRPIANSNNTVSICYRLAIDSKPTLNLSKQYMLKNVDANGTVTYKFTPQILTDPNQLATATKPFYYDGTVAEMENQIFCWDITDETFEYDSINHKVIRGKQYQLLAVPAPEWREELYRLALQEAAVGSFNSDYDRELLAYWRDNFNPQVQVAEGEIWKPAADDKYDIKDFWSDNVLNHPEKVDYWLDFIDTTSSLGAYSVNNIGRRIKATNSQDVRSLFNKEVPDIIYLENPGDLKSILELKKQMELDGQSYTFVKEEQHQLLLTSATGSSAYDLIREMLYQYLVYNTQVTMTAIPKYYLDVNTLIYIQNQKSGVVGDYVIKSISLPLGHSGTMNITANEALSRI